MGGFVVLQLLQLSGVRGNFLLELRRKEAQQLFSPLLLSSLILRQLARTDGFGQFLDLFGFHFVPVVSLVQQRFHVDRRFFVYKMTHATGFPII